MRYPDQNASTSRPAAVKATPTFVPASTNTIPLPLNVSFDNGA